MSKAIILTINENTDTLFERLFSNLKDANWLPERLNVNTFESMDKKMTTDCFLEMSDSGEINLDDFDCIIDMSMPEIIQTGSEDIMVEMLSNEITFIQQSYFTENNPCLEEVFGFEDFGIETWQEAVVYEVSETMAKIVLFAEYD